MAKQAVINTACIITIGELADTLNKVLQEHPSRESYPVFVESSSLEYVEPVHTICYEEVTRSLRLYSKQ